MTTTATRTQGMTGTTQIIPTPHFQTQMAAKGFTVDQVLSALRNPEKITEVRSRPEFIERGQRRYCGAGVAVVVEPSRGGYRLITLYADGVRTALRPDQMNDPYALASTRAVR